MGEPVHTVPVDYWWQQGDSSPKWLVPDAQHTGDFAERKRKCNQSPVSKNTIYKSVLEHSKI